LKLFDILQIYLVIITKRTIMPKEVCLISQIGTEEYNAYKLRFGIEEVQSNFFSENKQIQEEDMWSSREFEENDFRLSEKEKALISDAIPKQVPIKQLQRLTFPGQGKSDEIQIEFSNPFDNSSESQLKVTTWFRYQRRGESELREAAGIKKTTFAKGEHADSKSTISLIEPIFFHSEAEYELVVVMTNLTTSETILDIIHSDEVGWESKSENTKKSKKKLL
jgi:hypothetical protein